MNIGVCGLGKLGLPVALAIESKGHTVRGYDISPEPAKYLKEGRIPYQEENIQPFLENNKIEVVGSVAELAIASDILFMPIQTPHQPEYEGVTPIPETRADFDYTYLKRAVGQVAGTGAKTTLAVISTCLPGTYDREIKPLLEGHDQIDYVYTPQFIAMGTVLADYLHPEFNLIGVESEEAADQLERFYGSINSAPNVRTDITTAEGIKVSYNTWITAKTVIANMWGEIAERTGMNFSDIKKAWDASERRLWSTRYTDAGIGDSGGCHPRDNIAMSWLAQEVGASHNIWEDLMESRERHMEWLGDLAAEVAEQEDLPLILLGKTFKRETNITTGSAGILASNILKGKGVEHEFYDPRVDEEIPELKKAVYLMLMPHDDFEGWNYPEGSVIIDVWRKMKPQQGTKYIPIGNPNAIQDQRTES